MCKQNHHHQRYISTRFKHQRHINDLSGTEQHTNLQWRQAGSQRQLEVVRRQLRRHLNSCKEEVRYLAARLAEMTAQRDALHAQLRFASVNLSARGAEASHAAD